MADEHDQLIAKLVLRWEFAPEKDVAEAQADLAARREAGDGVALIDLLVERGLLTSTQAARITEDARKASGPKRIGPYELISKIGEGAMGAVYRGRDPRTGVDVAIKILPRHMARNSEFIQRFEQEAMTTLALDDDRVAKGLDLGEEAGWRYLVLEFVDGVDLGRIIRTRGVIDEKEAVRVAIGVAEALQYARTRNLVHRDIKPGNVMLTRDGRIKLTDFGLAKFMDQAGVHLTQEGMTVGTPNYSSPELSLGRRDLDVRSDVYSLGTTLYQALTGRLPFEGEKSLAVMNLQISGHLDHPQDIRPDLSDSICQVIERMLAKSPGDRYWPDELIRDLKRLEEGQAPAAHRLPEGKSTLRRAKVAPESGAHAQVGTEEAEPTGGEAKRAGPGASAALIAGVIAVSLIINVAMALLVVAALRRLEAARAEQAEASPETGVAAPKPEETVREEEIVFGRAKATKLEDGRTQIVWDFQSRLVPEQWYLDNVLPEQSREGKLQILKSGGNAARCAVPRIAFRGDIEVQVSFRGLSGSTYEVPGLPEPGIAFLAPAKAAHPMLMRWARVRLYLNARTGALCLVQGSGSGAAAQLPAAPQVLHLRLARTGDSIAAAFSLDGRLWTEVPSRLKLADEVLAAAVTLQSGDRHVFGAEVTELRIVGTPCGRLALADMASGVARVEDAGAASRRVTRLTSEKGASNPETIAAMRALALHYDDARSGDLVVAFQAFETHCPGQAVELWDNVQRRFSESEAVSSGLQRLVGRSYWRLGCKEKALSLLAAGFGKSPGCLLDAGYVYGLFGEQLSAIRCWQRCAKEFPRSPDAGEARCAIGMTHRKAGETEEAAAAFREVLEATPFLRDWCAEARRNLAEIATLSAPLPSPAPPAGSTVIAEQSFETCSYGNWPGTVVPGGPGKSRLCLRLPQVYSGKMSGGSAWAASRSPEDLFTVKGKLAISFSCYSDRARRGQVEVRVRGGDSSSRRARFEVPPQKWVRVTVAGADMKSDDFSAPAPVAAGDSCSCVAFWIEDPDYAVSPVFMDDIAIYDGGK